MEIFGGPSDRELPEHEHRNINFAFKSIKKSAKLLHDRFPALPGGLEPHFRVLFSAIFQGFTRENFHQGGKPVELGGSKSVVFCGVSNALLSTDHSFAPPILPGLLWGDKRWHAACR
jgi:hypothetical protein